MNDLEEYAQNKTKVRVLFTSGRSKWGWIHQYEGRWWLTRGNRVGFSMDTAIKIETRENVALCCATYYSDQTPKL